MATLNNQQMRAAVSQAYPGKGWQAKVAKMPEGQIVRLFNEFRQRKLIKL